MRYREAARKLRSLGCEEVPRRGKGSHRYGENRQTGRSAALPDWGSKDLQPPTLRAAVDELGIDWDDFRRA